MDLAEQLTPTQEPFHTGFPNYRGDDIRAHATVVRDLAGREPGILAVLEDDDAVIISFCVFEWVTQETGPDGPRGPVYYSLVFQGYGVSGGMRELRHTTWGYEGDGYLAYPDSRLIADAFVKLREWFDC